MVQAGLFAAADGVVNAGVRSVTGLEELGGLARSVGTHELVASPVGCFEQGEVGAGVGALARREVSGPSRGPNRRCYRCDGACRAPDPDDFRHGATTLFVAFKVATGKITNACYPRHRHQEFLRFLKQVANAHPVRKLHIPLGNYGIPEHPHGPGLAGASPADHPALHLDQRLLAEHGRDFFGIITRQTIHRGSFASVHDLINAIHTFVDG